jgi:hypothetical protein
MNFKIWFVLSETLDDMTKGALEKYQAPKDELAAFIKELEDEPDLIDRKAAFARLAQRFPPIKQKPVKQEDGRIKLYKDKLNANQITKPEFDTFMLFIGESNKDLVTEAMNLLRRFVSNDIITLEVKNNKIYITKDNETKEFSDFTRFESELHSIEGSLTQYKQKSGMFDPIIGEKKYRNNLVAKGENVWVFKGDAPDLCRVFGKNQKWCISSSSSVTHWFNYRINFHQTQYFVFDFNKDENDPARYVNPGVAPKEKYSEWVDARNEHSTDPENRESHVGINGYTSINQYKRYLVSKGIPESIWTTTAPDVWENDLKYYIERKDFDYAKKDPDPRVFPIYLKIVNNIEDDDFNTLTDEQKKEFVFGKVQELTYEQLEFAKNTSGYFNSLDLKNKIIFAGKTKNQELIMQFIEKIDVSELDEDIIDHVVYHSPDRLKTTKLIIKKVPKLSGSTIKDLITSLDPNGIAEVVELIIDTQSPLSDYIISNLIHGSQFRSVPVAKIIINKIPELSIGNINTMLYYSASLEIAKMIVDKVEFIAPSTLKNIKNIVSVDEEKTDGLELEEKIYEKNYKYIKKILTEKREIDDTDYQFIFETIRENNLKEIVDLLKDGNYVPFMSEKNIMDYLNFSGYSEITGRDISIMQKIELMGKTMIENKLSARNIIHIFRINDRQSQHARYLKQNIITFEELADFLGSYAIDKITLKDLRRYPTMFDSVYYRKFMTSMLRVLIRNDKDFVPNEELRHYADEDAKYLLNSHGIEIMASEEEIEQIKREVAS